MGERAACHFAQTAFGDHFAETKIMAKKKTTRKTQASSLIPAERIEKSILMIRGEKVMLDSDLADMYGVETGQLVRAVKRNLDRFPDDFMFQLSDEAWESLRCHFGISNIGRGGRRYAPYAFTEQGVAMLSSVLRSERAVQVNVEIMRTFVRLRRMLAGHSELSSKLAALEQKYDAQFRVVFDAIRQLMSPEPVPPQRMGFHAIRDKEPDT